LVSQDIAFLFRGVNQNIVGVVEGGKGVDLAALVGLGQRPYVLGIGGMVKLFMGPGAFGSHEGTAESSCGSLAFGSCRGGLCPGVGYSAVVIPPSDTSRVKGILGFEGKVAGLFYGIVKVFEGSVEVQYGHRQSAWGVMIQMLGLSPLQA